MSVAPYIVAMLVTGFLTAAALKSSPYWPGLSVCVSVCSAFVLVKQTGACSTVCTDEMQRKEAAVGATAHTHA